MCHGIITCTISKISNIIALTPTNISHVHRIDNKAFKHFKKITDAF